MQISCANRFCLLYSRRSLLSRLRGGVYSTGRKEVSFQQQLRRVPSVVGALRSELGRNFEGEEAAAHHQWSRPALPEHQQVGVVAGRQVGRLQAPDSQEAQHCPELLPRLPQLLGGQRSEPTECSEANPHSNSNEHRADRSRSLQEGSRGTLGAQAGARTNVRIAISAGTSVTRPL